MEPAFDHHEFNERRARQLRDEVLEQVEQNAHEKWKDKALDCVRYCADNMNEFTTDECVELMERYYPELQTHEGRAWGGVMKKAARKGWVINTGRVKTSNMTSNHARPKTVWRSVLWN